ncbi:2-keto-4-pentenoate hydratase [Mycolicibacterium sp.]|uniref:2-keto-4-pentenoate hydratase n=1 Tax=Mycolicibacterium sp. TaxID=2320850 RepID=UPI0037C7BD5A
MTTNTATVGAAAITQAAARLLAAQRDSTPCAPVRDLIGRADIPAAYAVQTQIVEHFVAGGRRLVGRKVGLTSPAVQQQLGVDQPDFGVLFEDMNCPPGSPIEATRLLQPKIEAEIAFVLSRDIDAAVTAQTVPQYVEYAAAALEIVDSRIVGWDITLGDTIADNASSGLYALGDTVAVDNLPDLAAVTMSMTANGAVVSTGVGADCLGSPWEALAWLANTSREVGAPLKSGEVVLSGALGPMVAVTTGHAYAAIISGIGSVTATFTDGGHP